MAANKQPIFSELPSIQWASAAITAANTAMDGTGTVSTVATGNNSGNAAGNFIQKLIARALGTNVQTVLRVFVNNGSSNATPANNTLIAEITLPATTASNSQAQPAYELPLNLALPAGYKLNVVLGTAVAAGVQVTAIGGQY
ncbi:hypothetical protein [Aestuariivirga litoralis]|uniref:hypothetical protein n=1 Tax=Aestuariivirga litoralis TaxID=2650924 RepID=UPI0018C496F8|nr:hypothetical protein [Aestuariivirga litoralis]MBG1232965.1 hypothetical protein [Aestuariivirga litoralis]